MADISSLRLSDNQTYYFKDNSAIVSISRSGNTYTATRHDGTTFEFTQKDDNTTYTFEDGVNSFTVTPSNGTAQTVTVTPSIPNATQSSDGLMSATDKTKLDGVANGAEVNQNAFSNIKVGSTTLAADSKTDTLEFVAGTNITLEPIEASDKITISSSYTNTTYTLTQDGTDGHKFTLAGTDGYTKTITIPDANTTYTIEADTTNNKIKLIPSSGNAVSITVPFATNATNATNATKATQDESGNNIKATYAASFSISDHTITLKNKNGTSLGTVTVPDNNTTYTFAEGTTDKAFSVTPSGGNTQTVSIHGLGSASTKDYTSSVTSGSADLVTSGAVYSAIDTAIDNLPEPMIFKGTLGTNGTISTLPTASSTNEGWTYKVITANTYPTGEGSNKAKVGDMFICAELTTGTFSWVYVPSGDDVEDTWRNIKVDGTEKLTTAISSGAVDFVSGNHIGLSFNATGNKLTIAHADTSSQASSTNSGRTYIQSIGLDGDGHVTSLSTATETVVNTDRYVNSAAFDYDSTNDNIKMTLTRAGSDSATVVKNIPKVSSSTAGVVPKGTAVSSQSQNTKFLREDGTWAKPSYTTNTNTTYTIGTSGNTVTLTPSSGSVQSITVPFATNATNATKATQDANGDVIATTYRKLSNNDFDTINATEVNAGDLIVTGVGRFTNGLYGDLSGTATKVSNSLKIQLNGGTTEGTNQFTYDGSAAKTVNVTKSAIGLGNVDNTADANKSVASANTAGSATKATQDESGNNIKATYAASFSISDHTITLKNKNGVSLGTVTVPDNNDNTWRKVQVNGTDILGTATNTNPLNLKAGTNVSLSNSSGTVTITATDTTYSAGTGLTLSGTQFSVSSANASTIINLLTTGSSDPTDNDYYIAQYAGGGTTTTSYHRRPHSALWGYIKGKADSTYVAKADIPTVLGTKSYGESGDNRDKKIKIKINPTNLWMLCFTVTLYQNYKSTKVMISGYNYDAYHWHAPNAKILGSSETTAFNVYFGYDANKELWVGFDGDLYTAVTVDSVTNGYQQISDYKDMFTISVVDKLTTLQTTQTVYRPWYRNETVTNATTATTASNLTNFQVSLTGSLGLDISTNSVGYVGGLTRADWNYQMADGAIYGQTYSAAWKHEIFGDYRTGHMSVRGKNNGTWQPWNLVLDSGNIGYVYSSTITYNPHERKFITSKSTSAWDAQVYSKQGYIDNVYVSFRPTQTNMAMMIGLDSNPSESTGYDKIDYCWYTQNSGSLSIYENNTSIASITGHTTYAAGDELRVEYSGGYVRYYHNGVLCRSVARAIGEKLYMDSSLHGASSTFYDVYFSNSITKASAAATADTATSATTASKLGSSNVGSATQPIYLASGTATACTYSLNKTVPSDAVFTDTKVTQTAVTASSYTNWRPLVIGSSNGATEGFVPSSVTDTTITASTISCQPSSGTIRATTFKGNATSVAEDISYINSGTSFIVHTDKSVFKTYLSRYNNLGISSSSGGMLVLAGTWNSGNYTSELALGMGDGYGIYYRGNNGSSEQAWQAVGRFTSTPTGGKVVITDGTGGGVTTTENVSGTIFAVTSTTGTTGGISLYGGTTYVTKYGIAFRSTSNQGKHGYVQSDWATYFTMDGADTRGWVFKNAASGKGNVASISSAGHMVLNGSLTLGGNTTNTSGVRQVYDSNTKSLSFVFVS